jgi:hypothetical protein
MDQAVLGFYDVFFECEDDQGTFVDYVRVRAEDEQHAEELVRASYFMPYGVQEVVYRGEC